MTQVPVKTRSRALLVGVLLLLGFGFTVLGICLIAFSDSSRNIKIGLPVALWGVLLGSYALHGTRWTQAGIEAAEPGGELEVRARGDVERQSDAAERREYEMRLELMLRRQMEQVLREQIAVLRQDVAGLRGEVLEAVDGRLRLERIETTRIIGSDLAALQNEVRRLNVERDVLPGGLTRHDAVPIRDRSAPMETGFASPNGGSNGNGNGRSELWTPSSAQQPSRPGPGQPTPLFSEPTFSATAGSADPVRSRPAEDRSPATEEAEGDARSRDHIEDAEVVDEIDVTVDDVAVDDVAVNDVAVHVAPVETVPAEPVDVVEPEQPKHTPAAPVAPGGQPTRPPITEAPAPHFDADPFAGLPRLSSFNVADVLPPRVEPAHAAATSTAPSAPASAPSSQPGPAQPHHAATASPSAPSNRPTGEYTGRRRKAAVTAPVSAANEDERVGRRRA
jgi:hypothetical protein